MGSKPKLISRKTSRRRAIGATITELLVASVLLGTSLAVVAELMSLSVVADNKLTQQFDAQAAANTALDRITRDVRSAGRVLPNYPFLGETLSSSTLILELPIYYLNRTNDPLDPIYNPAAPQNSLNGVLLPGHDVYVYKMVPDPTTPNQYILQVQFRYEPNMHNNPSCSYRRQIDPPMPLAKGIIGPLPQNTGPGTLPAPFSYLAKNPFNPTGQYDLDRISDASIQLAGSATTQPNPFEYITDGISGVSLDLEVQRSNASVTGAPGVVAERDLGVHAEAVLRLKYPVGNVPWPQGSPSTWPNPLFSETSEHQIGPAGPQFYD